MAHRPPAELANPLLCPALVALVFGIGCASWSSPFDRLPDGTLVNRTSGYRIGVPEAVDGVGWERQSIDGAALSFRLAEPPRDGGATIVSMLAACRDIAVAPQIQARNLRIGVGRTRTFFSGPTAHLGHLGWAQAFEAELRGQTVVVEAVTLVVGLCTYDWILVTPRESKALARAFQGWWTGFRPGPPETPAVGADGAGG